MLKARLQLLPDSHPAKRLLEVAARSRVFTWASLVTSLQRRRDWPAPIPDIVDAFDASRIRDALRSKDSRRYLLRAYRRTCVEPVLREYDLNAFLQVDASGSWSYTSFQPAFNATLFARLLDMDWDADVWGFYRTWAVVRVTGRWPLALFGWLDLPRTLPECPLCGVSDADVVHVLLSCPHTVEDFRAWSLATDCYSPVATRPPWDTFSAALFAEAFSSREDASVAGAARVRYVGRCFQACAEAIRATEVDWLIADAAASVI